MRVFLALLAVTVLRMQALLCAQDSQPLFKAGANVVRVDVQVEDSGHLVDNLNKDDILIFDEGTQQRLTYFSHAIEPLSLVLVLDVSGSMSKFIDAVARASRQAMSILKPGDKVAVILFARKHKLSQEFTADFESVSRQISSAVSDKTLGSGTTINEAVIFASEYLQDYSTTGRRAILVITDNLGLNYQLNDEQVLRKLHSANAVMSAIVTGRAKRPEVESSARYTNPDYTPSNVFALADETGGEAFRPEKVDAALSLIFERIRNRYALEYSAPSNGTPGEYHRIKVSLSPQAERRYPKAQLRARSGYYSAE
jgi:VWFA-related protein